MTASDQPQDQVNQAAAGDAEDTVAAVAQADLAELLAQAKAEIARLRDEKLRALAEAENTRRRAARERQEASQYAIANFARDLLSVADNLQRALASVDAETRAGDAALDALLGGVEMTERELQTLLTRHGVKPIAALGAPFDPHLHEAMFELPNDSVPNGTVVQVLQEGYTIHDRTLRPARVGIARGGARVTNGTPPASGQPSETEPYAGSSNSAPPPGSRLDETL
jgi:molecular chaperone GrpE